MFTIAIHFYKLSCECEPRVYESLVYPLCEIIQPCTTQCIARTIRKAKISCKTSMFKPSAQDFLTPFGILQRYTTLFDSFTDFSFHFYATLNFFPIMVRLTDVQRGKRIALLMQGQRLQQVANHFGVNVSTIERLVRRLRETGHSADRPRSGRPRVTSRRQDRIIRLAHLRNRHLTATETALNTVGTHNRQISPKIVGSRLREIGLRARCPYYGLPLTQARRLRRMAWLTAHAPRLFPMRQWRRVLFTHESRFALYRADGRRRVYRRRGVRFADACVVERDRIGGGSVMVLGSIANGIKSQLIIAAGNMTAVRYRDEILRPVAVPLVQQRNLILQQDNARPHVARVCQDFLANNNIAPLAWPPYSQDLTPLAPPHPQPPIEHMWNELDRRVRKRRNLPATLAQLRNALIDDWNNIPMRTVNALVNFLQRRIRAATAARGGHTRYWFSVWFWYQDLGGSYQWTRDLLITNQWNFELLFHTCTVL